MNTQSQIINEFLVRQNTSTTASFFTDAITKSSFKNALQWAYSRRKWPFTEGISSTTYVTTTQDDFGNTKILYPEGWKPDSIRIALVGGKRLKKINYQDLLTFREERPGDSARLFSDYNNYIYINSAADVSGTLTVFGQYTPIIDTTDDSASTLLPVEANEAIVAKMQEYAMIREKKDENLVLAKRAEAEGILDLLYKNIQNEQFAYQTQDRNMFEGFDVIKGQAPYGLIRRDQFGGFY